MPQKRNPVISETVVAAARMNAGLLGTLHQALIQEHERASHGWQLEWQTLPRMCALTGVTLGRAANLALHMRIDAARMAENVRASNGLMLAEALSFALAPLLGRSTAKQRVAAACLVADRERRNLVDILRVELGAAGSALDWDALRDEHNYLGASGVFVDQVLAEAATL